MDQEATQHSKTTIVTNKAERLRRPQLWVPLVAAGIVLRMIVAGAAENKVELQQPDQPPQLEQEATFEEGDDSFDRWLKNYQRAQAEIKNRLLTDSPISFFLGSVVITHRESGDPFRTITNPILMTDSDVFEPGISNKAGAEPDHNFDFAPWAIVGNRADYDFELSIDFMDNPEYDFGFFDVEGKEIEVAGILLPQNTSDFMSRVVFTSDLTVVSNEWGDGYIIQAPDGTQVSRDEYQ